MTSTSPEPATAPAATHPPAIEIVGLTRSFGSGRDRTTAIAGIDLTIGRGEVVALLGPNGAGKTTTLDILLGLSDPDGGSVSVLGGPPRRAVAAGRIGAVLQTGGLLADLTVRETVAVLADLQGARDRVDDVIAAAGLEAIARRRIGKCSGGEQQRVKFALALLPDPDVLVLDEPTAGMDVTARRRFWTTMHTEARAGRTVVFATHYLEEAEQFARRVVVLDHGRVVADAPTTELRASLGGQTVAATLPADVDPEEIIARVRRIADTADDISVDDHRLSMRTQRPDDVAAELLRAGATDLEVTAPSLESAFTRLTEDDR